MDKYEKYVHEYLSKILKNQEYKVSQLNNGFASFLKMNYPEQYNSFLIVYKQRQNRLDGFMRLLETYPLLDKIPCGCAKASQRYYLKER